jgi:Mn-dependent DtxR family transcriptional regulator
MAKGGDYRIKKLEKGPLQRFKNQNLLIKKYGEVGLQIYKAITGKRTTKELQKDLGVDDSMFDQVLNYMQDAGMVELEPTTGREPAAEMEGPEAAEEPAGKGETENEETEKEEEKPARQLEDIPPEEEVEPEQEPPPLEEKPRKKSEEEKPEEEPEGEPVLEEEAPPEEGNAPSDEEKPAEEEFSFEEPQVKKKPKPVEEEISFEEIKPIEFGDEERPPEKKAPARRRMGTRAGPEDESGAGEEIEPVGTEPEEPAPAYSEPEPEAPAQPAPPDDAGITFEEEAQPKYRDEPELSPVEKIISDKYGDVGLQVYSLIDGQRTAEEIMRDTGLTEPKLVEILDFMDEQGIIKLDYPKGTGAGGPAAPPPGAGFGGPQMAGPSMQQPPPQGQRKEEGFNPMIEGEDSLDEARGVPSPVEVPIKAPMDIVKSVQSKAKIMLKYGDKGSKLMEQLDGKNDLIDISLKLDIALFTVSDMLRFMMENGMVIMKPMSRTDVRKKYGDDGYAVYKKFGKEGLMLYELIGKEMTIKQMAEKIMKDKSKIIDMFIFIHKVLGIELPIDRDVLSKQLGI